MQLNTEFRLNFRYYTWVLFIIAPRFKKIKFEELQVKNNRIINFAFIF